MDWNNSHWEEHLRQPPIPNQPDTDEMQANVKQKIAELGGSRGSNTDGFLCGHRLQEVTPVHAPDANVYDGGDGEAHDESTQTTHNPTGRERINRTVAGMAAVAAAVVAAVGSYTIVSTYHHGGHNATSPPTPRLSTTQVQQTIRHIEAGHTISNIQVIHSGFFEGHEFAFASYEEDGKVSYASVTKDKDAMSTDTSTPSLSGNAPINSMTAVAQDGFLLVTGLVLKTSHIERIVLAFSDGTVKQVPVSDGGFWFTEKVSPKAPLIYVKHVVGVTSTGSIIENQVASVMQQG